MGNCQIIFTDKRKVEIQDSPMPNMAENQVLIETEFTLISTGTELSVLSGQAPADSVWSRLFSFPYAAGYTNLGKIIACGGNVSPELLGKRVVGNGFHAQYVATDLCEIRTVPEHIHNDNALFFNLAEIGMHGVRKSGIRWGDSVAIFGAGIIGQLCAQFCLMCGSRKVFVIDISDFRISLLPKHARLTGINPSRQDIADTVRTHNHGRMVDIVYELTGNPELITSEFDILREEGTMVFVSSPLGPTWFDFHDLCNRTSVKIVGAHNFSHPKHETADNPWTNQRDCEFFFEMVQNKDIDMSNMISHRIPFAEAPAIYAALLENRGRFMGVVLEWK